MVEQTGSSWDPSEESSGAALSLSEFAAAAGASSLRNPHDEVEGPAQGVGGRPSTNNLGPQISVLQRPMYSQLLRHAAVCKKKERNPRRMNEKKS